MAAAGAVGFKAYLAYSFSLSRKQVMYSPGVEDPDLEPPADYGTLARLAPVVAQLGLPLAIHAEDPTVLAAFRRPLLNYDDLLQSRPPDAAKSRDFADAPSGSPGVQTLYLSCLQLAKDLGNVWLAARWVSQAPAELVGLAEHKGAIAPGFDADLVIVDPKRKTGVRAEEMRSRQRHSALAGKEFDFAIKEVFLRGEPVTRETRTRGRMVRPAMVAR